MSRYGSAEDIKNRYIESMGQQLGSIFYALWNEMAWVYMKWEQYVDLYGKKPSRIDLLNNAAPLFFKIVQDTLFEDILVHIARLTDPPKSAGKPNLTIRCLPNFLKDKELANNIEELIKLALQKADFCRDWRNRHIAHKDFNLSLIEGTEPLKPASREKVTAALVAISEVLNAISIHYLDTTIVFGVISSQYGAETLLYVIDDGLKAKEQRAERIKAGKYKPEDYEHREL